MMTIQEISKHERASMAVRHRFGYDQYDDHIWRWLNHYLALWGKSHPVLISHPLGNTRLARI